MHHSRPFYDRPADLRSQIEAGQPSPPPATPHSGALAPDVHSIGNDVNDTWLVFDVRRPKALMRSGARSGSGGSSSVEAGRRVGTSAKWRLAQPPRSKACSAPCDLRYARVGFSASFKPTTQARDTDGVVWSNGCGLNAQPPTDARQTTLRVPDRDVPSCFVTCPYPAKIPRFSCRGGPFF